MDNLWMITSSIVCIETGKRKIKRKKKFKKKKRIKMSELPHGRDGKENEQNKGKGQADSILLIQRSITTTVASKCSVGTKQMVATPTDLKPEIC